MNYSEKTDSLNILVRVRTPRFTNEQHLGFHLENRNIFAGYDAEALGIQVYIEPYGSAVDNEDIAMEQIRRGE